MPEIENLAYWLADYERRLTQNYPDLWAAYLNLIDRMERTDTGKESPSNGDILPPFLLPDDHGNLVHSADFLAKGPLVISLNRGHWCGFCRHELQALEEISDQVSALGGSIAAISPETRTYANKVRDRCKLKFPILCDIDNGYALSLGLAVWLGEELKSVYPSIGIDIELFQRSQGWMVPIPATYVVGADGRIIASSVNSDFRKRMNPDDILAALRSL